METAERAIWIVVVDVVVQGVGESFFLHGVGLFGLVLCDPDKLLVYYSILNEDLLRVEVLKVAGSDDGVVVDENAELL